MVRCEKCKKEAWTRIDNTWLCPKCAAKFDVDKILTTFRAEIEAKDAEIAEMTILRDHWQQMYKREVSDNQKDVIELAEVKEKGTPGVMHEVDQAFYDLTIKERDIARAQLAEAKKLSPKHGPCCTCQRCGLDYDSCRCDLDDVVDELAEAKKDTARVAHETFLCAYDSGRSFDREVAAEEAWRQHVEDGEYAAIDAAKEE